MLVVGAAVSTRAGASGTVVRSKLVSAAQSIFAGMAGAGGVAPALAGVTEPATDSAIAATAVTRTTANGHRRRVLPRAAATAATGTAAGTGTPDGGPTADRDGQSRGTCTDNLLEHPL